LQKYEQNINSYNTMKSTIAISMARSVGTCSGCLSAKVVPFL